MCKRSALRLSARATLIVLAVCVSLGEAAAARAQPAADDQSAEAVIDGLKSQGYQVEINWVGGRSTVPLSECSVKSVNNPDRSATPPPNSSTTVYVDVSCPNEPDDSSVTLGPLGPFGPFGIG